LLINNSDGWGQQKSSSIFVIKRDGCTRPGKYKVIMDRREFEEIVKKALGELPEVFKDKLENVDVVIEDEPDMDAIKDLGVGAKGRFLGLYQGVPLKNRTHYYGMMLPDKITLYQANIERVCLTNRVDIYQEVKHVLQHEIAHHFGISDQRLEDLGTY